MQIKQGQRWLLHNGDTKFIAEILDDAGYYKIIQVFSGRFTVGSEYRFSLDTIWTYLEGQDKP